jgi:hypothetical protein
MIVFYKIFYGHPLNLIFFIRNYFQFIKYLMNSDELTKSFNHFSITAIIIIIIIIFPSLLSFIFMNIKKYFSS